MRSARFSLLGLSLFALIVTVSVVGDHAPLASAQNGVTMFADSLAGSPVDNGRGFDVSNMDTTAAACDNFFQYANGGWVKKNPIPAAYASWGRFNELSDKNLEQLRRILEDAGKNMKAA